jgi:hypothetical protein
VWDDEASQRFVMTYMETLPALQRFLHSPLVAAVWPEALNSSMESFFVIRESRYLSEMIGSNKLAELDLYLRHSGLRIPVLEVLGSDGFRVAIAERVAKKAQPPPVEIMPDLIAGALARRDINEAIRLLEDKKDRGALSLDDTLLLAYIYCLDGSVDKAEALAANNADSIKKNQSADWLWEKLEKDFGFHPPH